LIAGAWLLARTLVDLSGHGIGDPVGGGEVEQRAQVVLGHTRRARGLGGGRRAAIWVAGHDCVEGGLGVERQDHQRGVDLVATHHRPAVAVDARVSGQANDDHTLAHEDVGRRRRVRTGLAGHART
jgi:hypothetical protein